MRDGAPLAFGDDGFLVGLEVLKRDASAASNTEQWLVSDLCFDSRAAQYQFGKIPQQRRATGHGDASINDIARQFRWRFLQAVANRFDNLSKLFPHRFNNIVGLQIS